MIAPRRTAVVAAALLLSAGCADDGYDTAMGGWTTAPPATEPAPSGTGDDDAPPTETPGPTPTEPDVRETVPPTGVVVPVVALDNSFRPEVVEVAVGDEVRWENRGQNEHDLLYVETEEWGVQTADFQPGDVYSRVFTEPGEYRYYCTIHGTADVGMIGTVVVRG